MHARANAFYSLKKRKKGHYALTTYVNNIHSNKYSCSKAETTERMYAFVLCMYATCYKETNTIRIVYMIIRLCAEILFVSISFVCVVCSHFQKRRHHSYSLIPTVLVDFLSFSYLLEHKRNYFTNTNELFTLQ